VSAFGKVLDLDLSHDRSPCGATTLERDVPLSSFRAKPHVAAAI
jgi:hypothetical protein